MDHQNDRVEIDLVGLFYYLKKKFLIIAAAFLLCAFAGYLCTTLFITPQYTAETRMYVLNRSNESNVVSSDYQISNYILNDYKVLITGKNVTKEVIDQLGLEISSSALSQKINVSAPDNTRVLQITITDTSAERAASIANAVREVAAQQIQAIMDVEAVRLVYAAEVPQSPSSPNVMRNTGLAAVLGVVVAIVVLALIYILDDSIRTEEDVEHYLGLSVLGVIPESGDMNTSVESISANKKRSIKRQADKK